MWDYSSLELSYIIILERRVPPRKGGLVLVCGSVNRYAKTFTPRLLAAPAHCLLSDVKLASPNTAPARLNSGSSPKVSLPVPKGEPRAGTLG